MKIFCEMILQKQVIRSYQFLLYDRHKTLEKKLMLKDTIFEGETVYSLFMSWVKFDLYKFISVPLCRKL